MVFAVINPSIYKAIVTRAKVHSIMCSWGGHLEVNAIDLFLNRVLGVSESLPDDAEELVRGTGCLREIVIGQFAPRLFCSSLELFPLAMYLILIHVMPSGFADESACIRFLSEGCANNREQGNSMNLPGSYGEDLTERGIGSVIMMARAHQKDGLMVRASQWYRSPWGQSHVRESDAIAFGESAFVGYNVGMTLPATFQQAEARNADELSGDYAVHLVAGYLPFPLRFLGHKKVFRQVGGTTTGYNSFLGGLIKTGHFRVERGQAADGADVTKISYDVPQNFFFMRPLTDEVRETEPGTFLGRGMMMLFGKPRNVFWFTVTKI